MRIAVLYTKTTDESSKEVCNDLNSMGANVIKALKAFGHDVVAYDVNEKTFDKLRIDNVDFAFNVCERFNGQSFFEPHVASMLELLGIPYTGSGPLTLALCINKLRVKEILMHHGIPTPKYQVFYSKNKKLNSDLKFPLFVKPVGNQNKNKLRINEKIGMKNKNKLRKIKNKNKIISIKNYGKKSNMMHDL